MDDHIPDAAEYAEKLRERYRKLLEEWRARGIENLPPMPSDEQIRERAESIAARVKDLLGQP
jgi:hypothetical protein